jgi:HNH endonuclease/NUMOD4 motif
MNEQLSEESEIWRDIPGHGDKYQVSSWGRIRRRGRLSTIPGIILQPHLNSNGYPRVTLVEGRRRRHRLVHRLVMEMFVGPCPARMEINHIDGDKTNNRLDNLEYCTHKENMSPARHKGADKIRVAQLGERNSSAKLSDQQVEEIKALYATGEWTYRALAARFGVGQSTIGDCIRGTRQKAISL